MNENFDKTITIYNLHATESTDTWYRTVLNDCFTKVEIIRTANGNELFMARSFLVRIPSDNNYLSYEQWKDSDHNKWSLHAGDIIVFGEIDDLIGADFTAVALLKKYTDRAFKIKHYADNSAYTEGHYKVVG